MRRAWFAVVVLFGASTVAVFQCDTSKCNAGDQGPSCTWSTPELLACGAIDSGIYGLGSSAFGGGSCPSPNPGLPCVGGITVSATNDAGTTSSTTAASGWYGLALAPGTYSVCCSFEDANPLCSNVDVSTNEVTRVDVEYVVGCGGRFCLPQPK